MAGALAIDARVGEADGVLELVWRGKSNDRQPGKVVGPYLAQVLTSAKETRASIEMHFEKLEYFNSATITSIIQTIHDARSKGVRLTLVYDPKLQWQRLSFEALRVFAKDPALFALRETAAT